MVVRVEAEQGSVEGVDVVGLYDGQRRALGTSGSSGLVVVEFTRVPFSSGARIAAVLETCPDGFTVWFVLASGPDPVAPAGCESRRAGSVIWGRTERASISLDGTEGVRTTVARRIARDRTGLRIHLGPNIAFVQGDDLDDIGFGFGGELGVGSDFESGFGLGAVVGLMFHDLEGLDESLLRWSFEIEPRYTLGGEAGGARPYVALRAGYQVLDSEAGSGLLTEKGWGFGPGIGVVVNGPGALDVDLGARVTLLNVSVEGFDRSGAVVSAFGALRF